MLTKIVAKLKTGSVSNVVPFGSEGGLTPPYTVVKQENGLMPGWLYFRIIAHFIPAQICQCDDYIRNEVHTLLNNFISESRHGNLNQLLAEENNRTPVINDDGTLSMESLYGMPGVPLNFQGA